MKLLLGLLALVVIIYISSLNWRRTVKAVLFLVVIEGALRKWVFPQASELLYFMKDIVLLGAYVKYYAFSASEKKHSPKADIIKSFIFIVAGWCLFEVFNPSLGSPIVGFFGLKGYLLYIPLIWMLPNMFQSEEELYKFLRSHLLLVVPVGILGIVQFFSPATSPLNIYPGAEKVGVSTFGASAAVRVTGTFSYINNYAVYLIVCFGLLVPLISIKQSLLWRWVSVLEILLVVGNSFMTGSRGTIIAEVLFLLSYLGTQGLTRPTKTLRLLRKFLVPVIVVAIAASIWFRPAIDAFWLRTSANQDVSGRISGSLTEPLAYIKYKELDSYGTGATHQATPAIRKVLGLPPGELIPIQYESEMGRIALEIGPIGFLLWYGLRVSLIVGLLLVFLKLKSSFLQQLALAAFLIQAIEIEGQLVFHHTFSVYYWFLSSFMFLLPRLEQIEWYREQQ